MSLKPQVDSLKVHMGQTILGQGRLIDRLLLALFADGHLLVEGPPGLAKTKSIKALSHLIEGDFHRIQFTPDLLPADITGTDIFHPESLSFQFQKGPIFHNLILADEINRAAAKVQSALLEAMGERQVSVGNKTYPLPPLFLVMATQNPIEQEGVFSLPEAQLDRFMMHVVVGYPDVKTEKEILRLNRAETLAGDAPAANRHVLKQEEIFAIRREITEVFMDPMVEEYIVQIVMATRKPEGYSPELARWIASGVSPRATIYFDRCARGLAWLDGRDFVGPSDVQQIAHDILRHRLGISFEAEAKGMSKDAIIDEILRLVPVP